LAWFGELFENDVCAGDTEPITGLIADVELLMPFVAVFWLLIKLLDMPEKRNIETIIMDKTITNFLGKRPLLLVINIPP
jgi:hypothetical protein